MDNREKILVTSFRLFVEKGFTDVSISEVIKSVGLTKGGFYYYFESKEVLLVAVIDRYLFSFLDKRLEMLRSLPGTAQDKIKRFFQGIINFEQILREGIDGVRVDFRSFYLLLMEGVKKYMPLTERYRIFQEKMRETIENILEDGKGQGCVSREINSSELACHIVACGEGLLLQWVVNPQMDADRMIKKSTELIWQNFRNSPSEERRMV